MLEDRFPLWGGLRSCSASGKVIRTVSLLSRELPRLCARHGGSVQEFHELTVDFVADRLGRRFTVLITDDRGRTSETEYDGVPGRRLRELDPLGRIRRKPVRRSTALKKQ